jgi:hypothetical protein
VVTGMVIGLLLSQSRHRGDDAEQPGQEELSHDVPFRR